MLNSELLCNHYTENINSSPAYLEKSVTNSFTQDNDMFVMPLHFEFVKLYVPAITGVRTKIIISSRENADTSVDRTGLQLTLQYAFR